MLGAKVVDVPKECKQNDRYYENPTLDHQPELSQLAMKEQLK
jgi:hypothetical protein